MARRVRTTKNLAKRMDLQYFKQAHPLTQLAAMAVHSGSGCGRWMVRARSAPTARRFTAVGRSPPHTLCWGRKCNVCHVTTLGFFRAKVSDDACDKCHDAPAHHADKVIHTVSCASCHVEHQRSFQLASTDDSSCTQCHANLTNSDGTSQLCARRERFRQTTSGVCSIAARRQ